MQKIICNFLFVFFILLFFRCGNADQKQTLKLIDSASSKPISEQNTPFIADSLTVFSNIEQIEYCLPLPLNEYKENYNKSDVKARHVFEHKTKKDNEIIIQGLFRENPSVSVEEYFINTYQNAEEEGKIIEKKELLKNNNCFYAKGYWNNLIYKFKFIEVVWLRNDEVVIYNTSFDISDTVLWNKRLKDLLKSGAICN